MTGDNLKDYIISMRRHFHKHPELSFEEHDTLSRIKEELENMGLKVNTIPRGGLYADISGERDGNSVALRADVDALPVTEETNLEFRSGNEGVMHACGHDAHMAMLLGVARKLASEKNNIGGRVRLLFQVAEERPPGGAVTLIKEGALNGMDYVLGQHVLSTIPSGTVATFPSEAMAFADEFRIKIHGKGGHGSAPQETVDALVLAAEFVGLAQTIVSRMIDPFLPAVVTVGTLNSGYRYNIIAAHADITGTVRTFHREVQEKIRNELRRLLEGLCASSGATFEYEYIEGYPAVINNREVTHIVDEVGEEVLGREQVLHPNPSMGGEDFAYYLHSVPGSFYFLGVGNAGKGIASPQHSPTYDLDEDALENGVEIMYRATLKLLAKGKEQ